MPKSNLELLAELTKRGSRILERERARSVERRRRASSAHITRWNIALGKRLRRPSKKRTRGEWQVHGSRHRLGALPGWQVIASRLEPGRWYARGDVVALRGVYAAGSVRAWLKLALLDGGILERAPNAEFDHAVPVGRQTEAPWLYRLTTLGAAKAEAWRRVVVAAESGLGSGGAAGASERDEA